MIWAAVMGMNALTFLLMGLDKRRACRGAWRIPEKTLFLCAALFGAAGGVVGMRVFRHKTKHAKFKILVPLFLILHIALAIYMFKSGLLA